MLTESELNKIDNLHRIETCPMEKMQANVKQLTQPSYPHERIYGQYITIEEYIQCPPEETFNYLSNIYYLSEWTYSIRDFYQDDSFPGTVVGYDVIGGKTKIYHKVVANKGAMTVDYHAAWDQAKALWMVYLMRVIPAQLVLNRPGSVVIWTNCRHPYYDNNPFPETAPANRPIWVGDLWPMFYAGHYLEMQNIKHILEYRHQRSIKT